MLSLLLSLALSPPADTLAPVRQLAHRSFRRREAASRTLARMGERARPALRRGLHSPDHEVRRRCRDLLADLDARMLRDLRGRDSWPMVDALWYCEQERRYARAGEETPEAARLRLWGHYQQRHREDPFQGPPWQNDRAATQDLVSDWLAAGCPPRWVRAVLAEMRRRDQCFFDHHYGGRCPGLP